MYPVALAAQLRAEVGAVMNRVGPTRRSRTGSDSLSCGAREGGAS